MHTKIIIILFSFYLHFYYLSFGLEIRTLVAAVKRK